MSVYRLQDPETQGTQRWLDELMHVLDWEDRGRAMEAVTAALHTLRDHLPELTASTLGAQLPLVMRGMYYEGWIAEEPHPEPRTRSEWLAELSAQIPDEPTNKEIIAREVFALLQRHMKRRRVEEIAWALPRTMREVWIQAQSRQGPVGESS